MIYPHTINAHMDVFEDQGCSHHHVVTCKLKDSNDLDYHVCLLMDSSSGKWHFKKFEFHKSRRKSIFINMEEEYYSEVIKLLKVWHKKFDWPFPSFRFIR